MQSLHQSITVDTLTTQPRGIPENQPCKRAVLDRKGRIAIFYRCWWNCSYDPLSVATGRAGSRIHSLHEPA